jgi:hypothetical protein
MKLGPHARVIVSASISAIDGEVLAATKGYPDI